MNDNLLMFIAYKHVQINTLEIIQYITTEIIYIYKDYWVFIIIMKIERNLTVTGHY